MFVVVSYTRMIVSKTYGTHLPPLSIDCECFKSQIINFKMNQLLRYCAKLLMILIWILSKILILL